MTNPINFGVTCRALIIDQNELFMVRHKPTADYLALPGGHLEPGERIEEAMARELIEETSITPQIGKLLFVNDWVGQGIQRVEFFFWIKNGADYRHTNTATATHGFEISEFLFDNPTKLNIRLLPPFLGKKFPRILELGEDYPIELVRSS